MFGDLGGMRQDLYEEGFMLDAAMTQVVQGIVTDTDVDKDWGYNGVLLQIGAPLARNFAKQGYNLVIAQPAKGLVKECEGHGAKIIVVPRRPRCRWPC
jgi:hypothetical protein